MKPKLTNFLPQIRCSEETRNTFEIMCKKNRRTLSNMLQLICEDVAKDFKQTGDIFSINKTNNK